MGAHKAATNGNAASGNNTIKKRPLQVHTRTKLWCYASPKHQANDSGNSPNSAIRTLAPHPTYAAGSAAHRHWQQAWQAACKPWNIP